MKPPILTVNMDIAHAVIQSIPDKTVMYMYIQAVKPLTLTENTKLAVAV